MSLELPNDVVRPRKRARANSDAPEVADDTPPTDPTHPNWPPEGYVKCRVTRHGDGKIFTGEHRPTSKQVPFPTYAKGDICYLSPDNARKFEDLPLVWVEILDD